MEARAAEHRCRICLKPVAETSKTFPFCSERCRLVDLGKWFEGDYRVSRPLELDRDASTAGAGAADEDPEAAGDA